jgi:hypothetical protein
MNSALLRATKRACATDHPRLDLVPSFLNRCSSSSRSSAPHVKAPWAPPPCRARLIVFVATVGRFVGPDDRVGFASYFTIAIHRSLPEDVLARSAAAVFTARDLSKAASREVFPGGYLASLSQSNRSRSRLGAAGYLNKRRDGPIRS